MTQQKKLFTDFSYENLIIGRVPLWLTLRRYQKRTPEREMVECRMIVARISNEEVEI